MRMFVKPVKTLFAAMAMLVSTNLALIASVQANSFALTTSEGGTLYLQSQVDKESDTLFLIDTGSSLTVLNKATFARIRQTQQVTEDGLVIARLANGRQHKVKLYNVPLLSLSNDCQFTNVSVAVMNNEHNILGMELLSRAAPLGIELAPARLTLSKCDQSQLHASISVSD